MDRGGKIYQVYICPEKLWNIVKDELQKHKNEKEDRNVRWALPAVDRGNGDLI